MVSALQARGGSAVLAFSGWLTPPAQALGFSAYKEDVVAALESWRAEDKAATSSLSKLKGKSVGLSDEEAIAAQQKLFADARARCYSAGQAS